MSNLKHFTNGILKENPTFVLVLGTCPTLAVTTAAINGIGMGLATTFVLVFSNLFVALLKNYIPDKVRIAAFIVVIATFVTIVDLMMKAFVPDIYKTLGIFIPLIVVNCIILGRAEAFASKNTPFRSVLDALGNGTGFLIALILMSGIREILGSRTFLGMQVLPNGFEPWTIMILPAGAFLTFGLLMGFSNAYMERKKRLEREDAINKYRKSSVTLKEQEA